MWPHAKEGGQPPAARRDKKLVLLKSQKEFSLADNSISESKDYKEETFGVKLLGFVFFFLTTFKLTLIKLPFALHLSDQD